jgi:hypothetical protein
MADKRLYFDKIYIIESLSSGERRTGRELYEDLVIMAIAATPPRPVYYKPLTTKREFLELLGSIAQDAEHGHHSPILQIETHGCPDGIGLGTGEFLAWADLQQQLTDINVISNINLLVILAACNGAHLLEVIQPTDRAPVRAIIGPSRKLFPAEIKQATLAFYRTLFKTTDGIAAFHAMNEASGQKIFSLHTADTIFLFLYRRYLRTMCTETMLQERERKKFAEAVSRGYLGELVEFRKAFRSVVCDYPAHFERLKHTFFLCDLYPENRNRFGLTYEQCLIDNPVELARP